MRIGLIADIHGNAVALQTVLEALARDAPDIIFCAGDVAGLGPAPGACIRRLREADITTVRGNVDRWMVAGLDLDTSEPVAAQARWAVERLTADEHAWLAALPMTATIDTPGGSLTLVHSTPDDDSVSVSALTPDAVLADWFRAVPDGIVVGGHTHVQLQRRATRHLLLNPGSVGLPGTGPGTPDLPCHTEVVWAEYGLLDISATSSSVTLRRIPLPMEAVRQAAIEAELPYLDWWLGLWDAG